MPADERVMDVYIETLKRYAPDAQWCAAGISSAQHVINEWAIAKGGHTRTGMEDNVRLDRHTLAPSNAALVQRAAEICAKHNRPVATWWQAREILGLRIL
jgi:3-keto-5-aminohexanoate cleavage enzyme